MRTSNDITKDQRDQNMQIVDDQLRSISHGTLSSGHVVGVSRNWYQHYSAFLGATSYDKQMLAALGWANQYPIEHAAFLHSLYDKLHSSQTQYLPSMRTYNSAFEVYGSRPPENMYNYITKEPRYLEVDDGDFRIREYLHFLNAVWLPFISTYAPHLRQAIYEFLVAYYAGSDPEILIHQDPVYFQMGHAMHFMPTSQRDPTTGKQKFDWRLRFKDLSDGTYP